MYCNNCGKHNPKDSKFCQSCGAKIEKVGEEHKSHPVEVNHTTSKETDSTSKQKKKSNYTHWLFWWILDKEELEKQVRGYNSLGWSASRKVSTFALLFSMVITVLLIVFAQWDSSSLFDVAIMGVLAFFIYRGHRWAMVCAMILWSFEKIYSISTSPTSILVSVIWWAIYMHAFYEAFKVEQLRRKGDYVLQ